MTQKKSGVNAPQCFLMIVKDRSHLDYGGTGQEKDDVAENRLEGVFHGSRCDYLPILAPKTTGINKYVGERTEVSGSV